ncbi:MAG: RodZ domain-containing protein [Gammaproteobacteria bacterium]
MTDRSRNSATGSSDSSDRTPGEQLRKKRTSQKMDLHSAARDLHVDTWILEALEENNYSSIGAPIFVKGHLRNYAKLLGLPADDLIAAFEISEHPPEPGIGSQRPWGQAIENRLPTGWVYSLAWVLAAILMIVAGAWWYIRIAEQEFAVGNNVQTTIAVPASRQSGEVPSKTLAESDEIAEAVPGDPVETTQNGDPVVENASVTSPTNQNSEPVVPIISTTVANGSSMNLEIHFRAESWLEVNEESGAQLYYDLVPAGTTLLISGVAPLNVFFGNAPAVSLVVDGEPLELSARIRQDNTAYIQLQASLPQSGNGT